MRVSSVYPGISACVCVCVYMGGISGITCKRKCGLIHSARVPSELLHYGVHTVEFSPSGMNFCVCLWIAANLKTWPYAQIVTYFDSVICGILHFRINPPTHTCPKTPKAKQTKKSAIAEVDGVLFYCFWSLRWCFVVRKRVRFMIRIMTVYFSPTLLSVLALSSYMLFLMRQADEYILALCLFWIAGLDSIEFTHQLWFACQREW